MLRTVPVAEARQIDDFRDAAGDEAVDRLREAADPLKGTRLVHLSSTSFGGGVAELLHTHVALLQDLGIHTEWQVIEGSEEFFAVTKLVHNALQGAGVPWNEVMERTYLDRMGTNAARFENDADFVVVHDPQPVALLPLLEENQPRHGKWVWRCHIDLSRPMEAVWSFFAMHASRYDAVVFTMEEFARPGLPPVAIIPPSIDPHAPKNVWLEHESVYEVLAAYGIDAQRPTIAQISRFDPWKDPLGVIDAYRLVRREFPEVQLILAGSMAHDDPEAWHYLEMAQDHRQDDPNIHILSNLQDVGPVAINAFQRASHVVIQKSIREGFGLTASEAMWKEKPVVVGNTGGLRLQVEDGVTGFLVDSVEECADRILWLLRDPEMRSSMGRAGKTRVRERFLTVRELTDYLQLLATL